ncbi:MAG: TlpA family protein disulfide reductase, partial [Nannocystaceae bacterium]|nr:TlpA family protein disulfide reductase [Nannocystaceae bacterium]
ALLALASCDKGGTTQPPEIAGAQDSSAGEPAAGAGVADPSATDSDAVDPSAADPSAADSSPGDLSPAHPATADPVVAKPAADPAPPATTEPTASGGSALVLPKPLHRSVKKSCGKDPGVGQRLKSFKLPTTEAGKTYSNGTFRGRVLLVNFWGTWCKPCLKELPKFAQLYRRYRKHGMTLLAIATDDDADAVKDTLAKKKIAAKVAIAGEDYAGKYESPDFPFTFVVDHKGVIVASYFGYEPDCMGKLEADIREQLEKRSAAKK